MAKNTKICKVCGKEYEYCQSKAPNDGFRWQDVACCEEHGSEYFAAVLKARKPAVKKEKPLVEEQAKITVVKEEVKVEAEKPIE